MISLGLYFKVHQPYQLRPYHSKDIGSSHCYENADADQAIISKLADECYLPANEIILSLILKTRGSFKINYSVSGVVLELLLRYRPEVIDSFREIANTGCVEFLGETYYHSISYLYSKREFSRQVTKHSALIKELFGLQTIVLRNTELVHNNELVYLAKKLGFRGVFCEGVESVLQGRSPNHLYTAPREEGVKILLRNAVLSDDIAFRFDDMQWDKHPLTAEKFAGWIHEHPADTEAVNLFMDFETFGIHKKKESGIFEFLNALPEAFLGNPGFQFVTASEIMDQYSSSGIYDVMEIISWENNSGPGNTRTHNMMQNNTLKKIYSLENMVLAGGDEEALDTWGKLQSADYFFYMANEKMKQDTYKYMNPFQSSREVYHYYTNIVVDFEIGMIRKQIENNKRKKLKTNSWTLLNNN